jgi:hypothetical protein
MTLEVSNPATTRKMTAQMPRTNQDSSRMANAGVEVGAKMLGVCTEAPSPRANAVAAA